MKKEKKKKTSIYLEDAVFWRLKEIAVAKRIGDNEAMEEAVSEWVEKYGGRQKADFPVIAPVAARKSAK